MKKAAGKQVSFEMATDPGSEVYVVGTFNNWNPAANPLKDNPSSGHYKAKLRLPPGRYEYKFIVNGTWCLDPKCPDSVPNDHGSLNSVLNV